MSIRLRLTLLYTAILALTLIGFSATIYFIQSQVTLDAIRAGLERNAQAQVGGDRRSPPRPDIVPPAYESVRGRWTQIRNPDGTVASRTPDLGESTLPLSDAGLRTVQSGKAWTETAQVDNESLLIYSQPILVQDRLVRIVQVAVPLTEREQSLAALRLIFLIADGLVILAAFVIGWWLAGVTLRPIHQITHTAQAIGAERNFSRRVAHTGPNDEIGQLATTFNTMLTELESAYRQLEESLQAQRRFVADASHELRTPLTTVRGNIELLRDQKIDGGERAEILADTKDEVERLIRLVHQLLMLARMDAGRPLRRDEISITPLIEEACRQARLIAPQKSIVCDGLVDANVLGDHDALKQVLLIFLDNALVHTPANATVEVTSRLAGQRVAIQIRDTGAGIPPDRLPHIFERFYRGEASRTGAGTGLGLAIAKELIQAQGGTIAVESQVGRGSVFTITLPQVVR
jgi:signal transduction histidine kinase